MRRLKTAQGKLPIAKRPADRPPRPCSHRSATRFLNWLSGKQVSTHAPRLSQAAHPQVAGPREPQRRFLPTRGIGSPISNRQGLRCSNARIRSRRLQAANPRSTAARCRRHPTRRSALVLGRSNPRPQAGFQQFLPPSSFPDCCGRGRLHSEESSRPATIWKDACGSEIRVTAWRHRLAGEAPELSVAKSGCPPSN